MKREKIKVAVIFGGRSAEHEVSLQSAKNVVASIDKNKYEVILIGIDRNGRWYLNDSSKFLLNSTNPKLIVLNKSNKEVVLVSTKTTGQLVNLSDNKGVGSVDVVFPVLHGPFGEDGTIQGLLKLANLPFVGPSVLGSAIGMDKDVMKRLLRGAGLPVANFLVFNRTNAGRVKFQEIRRQLGVPFFIKPANLGSSIGVHKVSTEEEFKKAMKDAFEFDNKILVEEYIQGRELECSVLGNENPIASLPGEVVLNKKRHEFYSYEAKYIDEQGATLVIPAKLSQNIIKEIQEIAVKTFKVLCCEGMTRVDFFLRDRDQKLFIDEINTIPGFTKISMYPKLWEASGISYTELIDRLINLAIERFKRDQKLKIKPD